MEEGKIGEWLVSEGDQVALGSEILEIESEKVTNLLEASAPGMLKRQLVRRGESYPVGTLLGVIADRDEPEDRVADFIASYNSDVAALSNLDEPTLQLTEDVIEIDGQRLHYTSAGERDVTVVLIHGFGGSLSSWGRLQMALASSHRVVSVELPGHGTSSKQVGGGGSQDFARMLLRFLDELDIDQAHLIGHSLGGAIAAEIATFASARIKSLTLISNYGAGTKVDMGYIEDFTAASRRKEVKTTLKKLFFDDSFINNDMIETVLRLKRLEGVEQALRTIADKIQTEQLEDASIHLPPVPTQVIIGKEDKIINFDDMLLANIENLSVIEDAAHMPQLEKAAQTEQLIRAFLEQHQKSAALQA